jgi:hypothetical protein
VWVPEARKEPTGRWHYLRVIQSLRGNRGSGALGVLTAALLISGLVAAATDNAATDPLLLLAFLAATPFVLTERRLQSRRFLAVMLPLTAAICACWLIPPGPSARIIGLVLLGVAVVIMVWPSQLGLIGQHGSAKDANRDVRAASNWLADPANVDRDRARQVAADLGAPRFRSSDPEWLTTAMLFRVSLLQRAGVFAPAATGPDAYRNAGNSYWRAALDRIYLWDRFVPDAWDEATALRGFYEAFSVVTPMGPVADDLLGEVVWWHAEAAADIECLRLVPLREPAAIAVRDAMLTLMADELTVSKGDHSAATASRVEEEFARVTGLFDVLEVRALEAARRRLLAEGNLQP